MEFLYDILYLIPSVLIAFVLHELAHGLMSTLLGDPTPRRQGRLSLNPLKHLDPYGTVCLILFNVGWAKPVVVNTEYYKNKKLGMALVALAGPLMNFILAIISLVIIAIMYKYANIYNRFNSILLTFFYYLSINNLGLALFNLIPIPPLDGSKVIGGFLSDDAYDMYMSIERYGFIILMALLGLSALRGNGVSFISQFIQTVYETLLFGIFRLFGLI